jgi:sulfate transport system substrate-binding protein
MNTRLGTSLLLAVGLALASTAQAAQPLLNVSYDVMRDFYKDYNAAFQKHWQAEHNEPLTVQMSFGGSSKQARSVIDGLPADVITMKWPPTSMPSPTTASWCRTTG